MLKSGSVLFDFLYCKSDQVGTPSNGSKPARLLIFPFSSVRVFDSNTVYSGPSCKASRNLRRCATRPRSDWDKGSGRTWAMNFACISRSSSYCWTETPAAHREFSFRKAALRDRSSVWTASPLYLWAALAPKGSSPSSSPSTRHYCRYVKFSSRL